MQLTAEEEAHTRQVAAQIGRNPDDLIREGEQVKASGRRSAQQQAEGCAAFRRRWRPRDGSPARTQDPCADPSSWWRTATTARGVARANGSGARLMTGTGSGREPNWDDLAAPIAPTPSWRTEGQRQAEEPEPRWAGRASPGQARIQPLSGSPAATPSLRRGRDAHPQTPAGQRPKARLGEPNRHALGRSE